MTQTTTLTETNWGNTATLNLTVSEVSDRYQWDYQLVNNTIDYAPDDPANDIGIGIFGLYAAPGVVYASTVTSSAGWFAYIGDLDGEPGLLRWMSGEGDGILPGGTVTFSFQTKKVDILDGGVDIWDPGFALGGGGPAKTPGEQPTIDLAVNGLPDKDEEKAPGRKIHINDNFEEGQKTNAALVSDNLPDPTTGQHQIKVGDPDLVPATLSLKSGVMDWSLVWTVDPKVKVWYKGWIGADAGKRLEANDNSFKGFAVPATIDVIFEGIDIGAGSVKVELRVNKGNLKVADEVAFTVYTGLQLTGTKAADAVGQLERATGWTLKKNAAGDVWRTGGALRPEQWRTDAQAAIEPVFESDKVTSIGAENKKEILVGSWALKTLDPGDIAVFFTADERFGAGAILHEIVEQYNGQVLGKKFEDAHDAAIVVEAKVVAGGGTRTDRIRPIGGTNKIDVTIEFQGGIIVTMVMDFDLVANPTNVNVRRP